MSDSGQTLAVADPAIVVRRAGLDDRPEILALAQRSLGWAGDERDRAFFSWKHDANPFGPSPSWVALDDGRIVGFRTLLRWELRRGEETLRCVRAVDTATDPAAQGRGIFRTLTLGAVEALTADGFDAVFNTPNSQSRPGYLKMGWSEVGRPTLGVVPRSPLSLLPMARSQAGAEKWSEPVTHGQPATDLVAGDGLAGLLAGLPPSGGLATPRTLAFLRWRYSFEPLHYRAVEVRGGWCIFRVRRRGPSTEVAVCEWLSAEPDRRALHRIVRACGDYAVGLGLSLRGQAALPLPRRGPRVTWRPLARPGVPTLGELAFGLGDLELF
jgi:GNAT superfamily N-acetyltransferase